MPPCNAWAIGGTMVALVTKKEAAQLFGVSIDTIGRRLKRGELRGHKEPLSQGLTWMIEVPEELLPPGSNGGQHPADSPGDPPANPLHSIGELQRLEDLVVVLQTQLKAEQEERASKNRQIEQLHVLLQQAQAALPAPRDGRPWWRFW